MQVNIHGHARTSDLYVKIFDDCKTYV